MAPLGALVLVGLLAAAWPIPTGASLAGTTTGGLAGDSAACPNVTLPTPICHVFVIFLENQEAAKALKQPYLDYLAKHYTYASQFYSVIHYSFPNYLAATSGVATNYIHPIKAVSIANLIHDAKQPLTWASYMQSIPYPCDPNGTAGYRVAHDPFVEYVYVENRPKLCDTHIVGFPAWDKAIKSGTLPNYAFLAPNTTNDCWKTGVVACDRWLHQWMTPLLNDSFFAHTAFILTFDEGNRNDTRGVNGTKGGGHVYTAVISPYACAGKTVTTQYNQFNILTTTEWLLDLGRTGVNDSWLQHPPMKDMFCFKGGAVGLPGLPVDPAATGTIGASTPPDQSLAPWISLPVARP